MGIAAAAGVAAAAPRRQLHRHGEILLKGTVVVRGHGTMGTILAKVAIVLVPSYGMAWLTDKMVYVVPTLAACAMVASHIDFRRTTQRNVDDQDGDDSDDTGAGPSPDISES